MSEATTSNENPGQPAFFSNGRRESAVHGSSQVLDTSPEGVEVVSENERSPSIQAAATSSNGQQFQPEISLNEILLKQNQLLQLLTRELSASNDKKHFQENEPKSTFSYDKETKASHRKFFGLNKSETGVNNQFDYEQKYPEDRPGEELSPHARVWSTYLDEAETYDRERVEGWKETADVLLVFAGLFSGVITTFVSQASQSLQQDNTQVSASLLFEIAQLLRAQSSGTPINNIPNSTLTPTSLFTPSTNAFLVNGLWFTSLAITLCTALFAVLSKQWLYYYLSSISGTPLEKAKARQFRFEGFELWKVGAIVDLLPVLLHLAVGVFLIGIIVLLFPLDVRVAWTIVAITGVTYVLYFVSVILPIRYPGCPYTTSLTIYIGVLFFFLAKIFHWISAVPKKVLYYREAEQWQVPQSGSWHLVFSILISTFPEFPKFTNWREEKIKKAVRSAAALDFEALHWLYDTSANRSVHQIIGRCAFMHRNVTREFGFILDNFWRISEVNETNILDIRHGLYVDLLSRQCHYWSQFPGSNMDLERKLGPMKYRNYSCIAKHVVDCDYDQILTDAITYDLKLPLVMWQCFFARASGNLTVAAHVLTSGKIDLFYWKSDPNPDSKHRTDVSLWAVLKNIVIPHKWKFWSSDSDPDSDSDSDSTFDCTDSVTLENVLKEFGESRKWKFDYLFRYLRHGNNPDYSLDKTFETRYLLLLSVYQDLTSDQPLIPDKEQRQQLLSDLFTKFDDWLRSKPRVSPKQYLAFFIDICSVDAFWSESMTDGGRRAAVKCLGSIWKSIGTDGAKLSFPLTKYPDPSSMAQDQDQWCSRGPDSKLSQCIFTLLFVPRNRDNLSTFLNDPNAVSCLSNCFQNLLNCPSFPFPDEYIYSNLMHPLKTVKPGMPLFTTLYDTSVLVQLWKFLVFRKWDAKRFLVIVKSKLDRERLDELYSAMNEQAQLEAQSDEDSDNDARLAASAREFGQSIGVASQVQPSVENQSTEEKNHDSEERAQVEEPNGNERKGNSIVHRMKKYSSPFGRR